MPEHLDLLAPEYDPTSVGTIPVAPDVTPRPPRNVRSMDVCVELLPMLAGVPAGEQTRRAMIQSLDLSVREHVIATAPLLARFRSGETVAFFRADVDPESGIEIGDRVKPWTRR